jgi:RNA polymerase sigma factor for flagellar operon FliA
MRRGGRGLRLLERPAAVEAALWRRLKIHEDLLCRERLFARFSTLARNVAMHEFRRRPPYGLEKQDFEQLAYGGLLESIDRFDPMRGGPFEAFARPRIRGAISDGIAKSSESGAQYSFRRRVEAERLRSLSQDGAANPLEDLSSIAAMLAIGLMVEASSRDEINVSGARSELDGRAWCDMQEAIRQEIERLPENERRIMHGHYIDGVAFSNLAALLNISKGRVSQIHRAALLHLRKRLSAQETRKV